jgi:DNA polymerase I-like protein with 3'-5' exonuclease and polymerase domains
MPAYGQLAKGMDSHGEVTKEVLHVMPDDPLWKEKRDIAKRLNFGGIFQIGGETFQATLAKLADIHLPLDECNRYVRGWRSMYPEYGTAYRRAESVAKQRGYVRVLPNTPYEIKSYFGPRDFHNTAWNRIVQGSLAEAFKMWLADIERRWPGYMVLTIHDSVLLEAREDEGDRVAEEIAAFGAELMTSLFAVEMKVDVDRW